MASKFRMRDEGVTDVIGSILLVAITVGMMVAVSGAILTIPGPVDQVHADVQIAVLRGPGDWGDGDEVLRLRHLGGEDVPADGTQVRLTINGTTTIYEGAALDGDFADGTLSLGEAWTRTVNVPATAIVDVGILNPSLKTFIAGASFVAAPGQVAVQALAETFPVAFVDTKGTTTDFANAQNDTDGGAAATLTEATNAPTLDTSRLSAPAVSNTLGVGNPDRVLTENGQRADMDNVGDFIEVDNFNVPATAITIQKVQIGINANYGPGSGALPDAQLTYQIGLGLPVVKPAFEMTSSSDLDYLINITGDRIWTIGAIEAMTLEVERVGSGANRDLRVDHLFVEVTYTEVPTTDMDIQFDWVNVPAGTAQELQIRYKATTDTFTIQLWNGAGWTSHGLLDSTSYTLRSIAMTPAEYQGGFPKVRFVDVDSGVGAGQLEIDHIKVRTS